MDKLNILYTTDHNYVKCMLVSLYSLLENNQDIDIVIHIIFDNFEKDDFLIIENIINRFTKANVYFYSFEKIKKIIEEYDIPDWRGTKIANARLFFTSCINADNLLYLDSDTIVVNSLKGLEAYDKSVHMVQDALPTTHWKNLDIQLEKYCNSGVIWINTSKWIEEHCDEKIINLLRQNVRLTYPDQDLINMALRNEIELLPPKYNLISIDAYYNSLFLNRYYKQAHIERDIKEIIEAKKNPIILHGTPFYNWRQWEQNSIHPYTKEYDEYLYKIFGKIEKEEGIASTNPLIYRLYLHSKIICPPVVKNKIKQLIKTNQ